MRKLRTLRTGDLTTSVLRMQPEQERKLLSRLARGGLMTRARRGLYLPDRIYAVGGIAKRYHQT